VASGPAADAFRAEAERLSEQVSGWDQVTLIAKATGRAPATPADDSLFERYALRRLSLG
jgi:hypothetical protein